MRQILSGPRMQNGFRQFPDSRGKETAHHRANSKPLNAHLHAPSGEPIRSIDTSESRFGSCKCLCRSFLTHAGLFLIVCQTSHSPTLISTPTPVQESSWISFQSQYGDESNATGLTTHLCSLHQNILGLLVGLMNVMHDCKTLQNNSCFRERRH